LDGIQALSRMKSIAPHIPVVIVTGYGTTKTAVQAMQLGAATLLEKPFDNDELVETVRRVMAEGGQPHVLAKGTLESQVAGSARMKRPVKKTLQWTTVVKWMGAVCLAAAVIGGPAWFVRRTWGWQTKTWPVTFSHPSSMAWEGAECWVTDWVSQEVLRVTIPPKFRWPFLPPPLGETVQVMSAVKLSGHHLTGVACSSSFVFICDPQKRRILRYQKDAFLTAVSEAPSPGPNPSGLCWDGSTLWSCDAATKSAYIHMDNEALTVKETFLLPGKRPIGVAVMAKEVWSVDADHNIVYRHLRDAKLSVVKRYRLPAEIAKEVIAAFTIHDGVLWLVVEGRTVMIAVKLSALKEERVVL